ncbi:HipA domain-containing protein [Corynebacterium mastitidis]|uniref:HipA domain-containing protein n=1 Tax=Corynebacterium mastitidis TaxID=161890 RepID=UPI0030EABA90
MPIDLDLYLGGVHAGTITHRSSTAGPQPELTYTERWLNTTGAFPLSLSLPLQEAPHSEKRTRRYLESLLPENSSTLADWQRRYRGMDTTDTTSVLAVLGEDVAGAAQFVPAGRSPDTSRNRILLTEHEVGKILADLRRYRGAMPHVTQAPRISLAGQQAKIGLYYDETGWWLPHGDHPSTHILKPSAEELSDVDINEAAMLRAASVLGIRTRQSTVHTLGGQRVFITQRYDRQRDPNGMIQRIHQEDFTQALGYRPQAKYQKDNGPALQHIIPFLRKHLTNPEEELDQFNRLLAFNVAISNADAHAKNHSILITPTERRLAPAYDLLSVAAYPAYSQELALSVGRQYQPRLVQEADWIYYARKTHQDPDRVLSIVMSVWSHAPDAVADALAYFGSPPGMCDIITETVESTLTRLPRLP